MVVFLWRPPVGHLPLLGVVHAVNDVEHGAFARAVRADDGADFVFSNV